MVGGMKAYAPMQLCTNPRLQDEYEMASFEKGYAPFSRAPLPPEMMGNDASSADLPSAAALAARRKVSAGR